MSLNPKFLNLVIYSNFDMTGSSYFLIRVKKKYGYGFSQRKPKREGDMDNH